MTRITVRQAKLSARARPNRSENKSNHCRHHDGRILMRFDMAYYAPRLRRYMQAGRAIIVECPNWEAVKVVEKAWRDAIWALNGQVLTPAQAEEFIEVVSDCQVNASTGVRAEFIAA